jgi:hypothetical protein
VGQALFAAGAGLSSLHGIIADLEREQGDIFKASGSKPELNRAIREYNECMKESRALSLSTSEWEQCRKAYDATINELTETERELGKQSIELARLRRISKALPKLAVRKELKNNLDRLENMSRLHDDFPEQLHAILQKREIVTQRLKEARSRRSKLETDRQGLNFSMAILDQEETIDSLHQRLGVDRQARGDRPGLHEKMIRARTDAESLLRRVAPERDLDSVDALKGVLGKRQGITKLGNRFGALEQNLLNAQKQSRNATTALTNAERQLECLAVCADPVPLSTALAQATKAGDLDAVIRGLRHDSSTARKGVETLISSLGFWHGTPEELMSLKLPLTETVMRFLDAYLENEMALKESRLKLQELRGEMEQVQCDIRAMDLADPVVTMEDLTAAREQRELRWQLVRRAWLDGDDVSAETREFEDGAPLPEAYEKSVRGSDDISDRLRTEAERVHTYAGHRASLEKLFQQINRWSNAERDTLTERDRLEATWKEQWQESGIQPGAPREMRDWLDRCIQARRVTEELLVKEAQLMPNCEQRAVLTRLLLHELEAVGKGRLFPGDELKPVLEYTARINEEMTEAATERNKLQEDIRRLVAERKAADEAVISSQAALVAWRLQWQAAIEGLGLSEGSTPEEATEALENLRNCLEHRDSALEYKQRIDAIDGHAKDFERDTFALVKAIGPELEGLSAEQAVVKLQSMLTETRKARSVLDRIQEDIDNAEEDIRVAWLEEQSVNESMTALKKRAGCIEDEELAGIETSFREYIKTREALEQVTTSLLELSEGIPLGIIEEQAAQIYPDELPAHISDLERSILDEIEPRVKILSEKKGATRIQLEQMDGSGKAAEMMEKAEASLARVRRLAGRYVRLKVAGQVLKREIELYRREHQDPVLRIASRYFSQLPCGAYDGLKTDVDDSGLPILTGAKKDGRSKTVDQMSSGTRDQLYLALRLATLEWRLEKHQPIPFIADDLLVNFDDARSGATLRALSELGVKNQVILFTHHSQIVNIAEGLGQNERIFVHYLNT